MIAKFKEYEESGTTTILSGMITDSSSCRTITVISTIEEDMSAIDARVAAGYASGDYSHDPGDAIPPDRFVDYLKSIVDDYDQKLKQPRK